jgi:TIR domain
MNGASVTKGHAFISYVREDSPAVDELQRALETAGVKVWRDTSNLWPGEDWRARIRQAITGEAFAFIACFSRQSLAREKSYQNQELTLAIEELRQRQPDTPWLIPVRLDDCTVPDPDLGGGRTLSSIQHADLFGAHRSEALSRLVTAVLRILGSPEPQRQPDLEGKAVSRAPIWRHAASQIQGARGTVGGSLYLTATQLLFEPNRFESAIGGQQWSTPLGTIRSVGIQLPGGNVLKGGLRDRLRIDLADGSFELFVVDQINEVIRVINQAIARPS